MVFTVLFPKGSVFPQTQENKTLNIFSKNIFSCKVMNRKKKKAMVPNYANWNWGGLQSKRVVIFSPKDCFL